jgi:hypothetical protein
VIHDDDSSDPHTRQILDELSRRHRVAKAAARKVGKGKHGGLYANMQQALDDQEAGAIVCFLQDDMQMTRTLGQADLQGIAGHFGASGNAALLHPVFMKGCDKPEQSTAIAYDALAGCYRNDRFSRSAGAHYSDVCIASVDQLRALNWQFRNRESGNEEQARQYFPQMHCMRDPFLAWLPNVPAWRGRTRTLGLTLATRLSKSGFYPLAIMDAEEQERFMNRDPSQLPVAENWLRGTRETPEKPWIYHPLQGRRWLTLMDSIERRLRGR